MNKWALSLGKNVARVEQLRMFAGSWFQAEGAGTENERNVVHSLLLHPPLGTSHLQTFVTVQPSAKMDAVSNTDGYSSVTF